jgi:acetylornithine deacetylase/succinyl-diaminopimelate desuccinylase-like protein
VQSRRNDCGRIVKQKPIPLGSGKSIYSVASFKKMFGIKFKLFEFGLNSDTIHYPNENYRVINFFKEFETIRLFFMYYNEHKYRGLENYVILV